MLLIALGGLFLWYSMYDLYDFARDQNNDAGILAEHLAPTFPGMEVVSLTFAIAAVWTGIMLLGVFLLLSPLLQGTQRESVAIEPEVAQEEASDTFPGEVTDEVEEWLLRRGLDREGKPFLGADIDDRGDKIQLPAQGP